MAASFCFQYLGVLGKITYRLYTFGVLVEHFVREGNRSDPSTGCSYATDYDLDRTRLPHRYPNRATVRPYA